jgi:UDP-3-O-[3-hydroxymyristoyl] N-acetylglucosamine deacetylase
MNFINNITNEKIAKQSTINSKIFFSGVGIHSGKAVKMSLEPSGPNTGIIFERTDINKDNIVHAIIENIDKTSLCTKIKNIKGVSVSTIEHLMAALNGLNIDNIIVKINSPELPALDGSSYDYVKKILKSGIKTQTSARKCLKILRKVEVKNDNKYISITPSNNLSIDISISYPETIIGNSNFSYNHSENNFIKDLSKARTFALLQDIDKMRIAGYAMGGNINNAIIVDKFNILNPLGLRVDREFVKHKALDCIGDFYLLGMPLIGSIKCFAPGHNLNLIFLKEILKDKRNYKIETLKEQYKPNEYIEFLDNNNYAKNQANVA